ncbi:MAG: UDP-glucose 4-epimerase GalE [Methylococcales bacterium]
MNILIVDGAGYIGSHMVKFLLLAGYNVTAFDNLSTGHKDAIIGGRFICGDLSDRSLLNRVLLENAFDAVMHFASSIQVGESVKSPHIYYRNNFSNTLNLLDAMVNAKVNYFIFSSMAAIFGEPEYHPIDEQHSEKLCNPYGRSKWIVEQVLEDYDKAYGLKSICLRYFNAAGTDPDGELGERHDPETHLIPILLQVASGKRDKAFIYGTDYPTQDGTCVRDYIHILDLCNAHVKALDYLRNSNASGRFNLGNGSGFSVTQVIEMVEMITEKSIMIDYVARRLGDLLFLLQIQHLLNQCWDGHHNIATLKRLLVMRGNLREKFALKLSRKIKIRTGEWSFV